MHVLYISQLFIIFKYPSSYNYVTLCPLAEHHPLTPSPFAFNILNEKSICPTVIFFNFLVRFTYMYINKIQNSFHIVFFCIYRSSKFTQFTILVNMSKLCNYIIIHTQKHTKLYFYFF